MPRRAPARASLALAPATTALLLLQSAAGLGNETATVAAPPAALLALSAPPAPPALAAPAGAAPPAPAAPDLLAHARRQNKGDRSTSSSSGEARDEGGGSVDDDKKESLDLDTLSDLTEDQDKNKNKGGAKYRPKSSEERRGWRKWHRKCPPCPEQSVKWRDPRVLWICGGYQRARRSFKSACMMRYRNCQDGTMFVKLYDHRCQGDVPGEPRPHGEHFFYTYSVRISGDDSKTGDKSSSEGPSASTDSSEARRRVMDWRPDFPPPFAPAAAAANRTLSTNITLNYV